MNWFISASKLNVNCNCFRSTSLDVYGGRCNMLEHVEDRDEAGGGPSVAEVVGLDELFYNLF